MDSGCIRWVSLIVSLREKEMALLGIGQELGKDPGKQQKPPRSGVIFFVASKQSFKALTAPLFVITPYKRDIALQTNSRARDERPTLSWQ